MFLLSWWLQIVKLSDSPALRKDTQLSRIKKLVALSKGHQLPIISLQTPWPRTKLAVECLQLNAQWQVLAGPGVMLKVGHGQQTKNV